MYSISVISLLFACAPKTIKSAPTIAPGANIHLRNTFDSDPSMHIGKFLPQNEAVLDESQGRHLACSSHIKHRFVEASGVRYSEWASISTEAAMKMGIPIVASANGEGQSSQMVHVDYELTGKLVAEVDDPVAFATCCESNPLQCASTYIGEFLQGTGEITASRNLKGDGDGHFISPQGAIDGKFSQDAEWGRTVTFTKPTYFAFKSSRSPLLSVTENNCGDWVNTPPQSETGFHIVGTSRLLMSEKSARYWAQQDALGQAHSILGAKVVALQQQSMDVQNAIQSGNIITPEQLQQYIEKDAERSEKLEALRLELGEVLTSVEPKMWCITVDESKKSPRYMAAVMLYVPKVEDTLVATEEEQPKAGNKRLSTQVQAKPHAPVRPSPTIK